MLFEWGLDVYIVLVVPSKCVLQLNCETDFVARTEDFHTLLMNSTMALMKHSQRRLAGTPAEQLQVDLLDANDLQALEGTASQSCGENLAEAVGKIGERLVLRRGVVVAAPSLSSYVHSADGSRHAASANSSFLVWT